MTNDPLTVVIESALGDLGLPVDRVGAWAWLTMLSGEHKRTLPLHLVLRDRHLHVTALFAGRLDEAHGAVYARLLARNQRSGPVHFALDDDGNLVIVGQLPREVVDAAALDELLGRVLQLADDAFDEVLRRGFATYLESEQQWRESAGMPANPIGDAIRTTDAVTTGETP